MKCLIVFTALLALTLAYYPDTWDNFDADHAFGDPMYLLASIGCFLDEIPCNPTNEFFKKYIPDALKTACLDCSPAQKHIVKKFFEYANKYYPEQVVKLCAKYDQNSSWKAAYFNIMNS